VPVRALSGFCEIWCKMISCTGPSAKMAYDG
jgi:hypothetical protein